MYETMTIEIDPRGVATLWLDRAEKHNAMSGRMIEELPQACARLAEDDAVRAVVLAARGKSFCAGGDLRWMQDQMAADAETRRAEARIGAQRGSSTALCSSLHTPRCAHSPRHAHAPVRSA